MPLRQVDHYTERPVWDAEYQLEDVEFRGSPRPRWATEACDELLGSLAASNSGSILCLHLAAGRRSTHENPYRGSAEGGKCLAAMSPRRGLRPPHSVAQGETGETARAPHLQRVGRHGRFPGWDNHPPTLLLLARAGRRRLRRPGPHRDDRARSLRPVCLLLLRGPAPQGAARTSRDRVSARPPDRETT